MRFGVWSACRQQQPCAYQPLGNFFPPAKYDPYDWAGLTHYLPQSKFCVLSIFLCFTNLSNSYFMPGIVLGAKDKTNRVRQPPVLFLIERQYANS